MQDKNSNSLLEKLGLAAFVFVNVLRWASGVFAYVSLLNPFELAFYGSGALLLGTTLGRFHPQPTLPFAAAAFCLGKLASYATMHLLFMVGATHLGFTITHPVFAFLLGVPMAWAVQAATRNAPRPSNNKLDANSYERRMVEVGLLAFGALIVAKLLRGEELFTGGMAAFVSQYMHYDTYNASVKMLALAWCVTDILAFIAAGYLLRLRMNGAEDKEKSLPWIDLSVLAILGRWVAWFVGRVFVFPEATYDFMVCLLVSAVPVSVQFFGGSLVGGTLRMMGILPTLPQFAEQGYLKRYMLKAFGTYGAVVLGLWAWWLFDAKGGFMLAVIAGFILYSIGGEIINGLRRLFATAPALPDLFAMAGLRGDVGIPVGHDNKDEMIFYNRDRHIVTLGPIGSGKFTTAQAPAVMNSRNNSSAFIIDVKGQICAVTYRRRKALGHTVYAINPFHVLKIRSRPYNPLAFLNPHSLRFSSDCLRIAEGIIEIKKGDHWELSALDYMKLLVMWTVYIEEEKNLVRVAELLALGEKERQTLCKAMTLCDKPEIAMAAARYAGDGDEVRDCVQTARVQAGFLYDHAIQEVLRGGDKQISFADLKKKKQTVYLIIPPELLHTHGKFLRLVTASALMELLAETTKPEQPVMVMLDEFAQLGALPFIQNIASIGRDYSIRLWLILQNLPQLQALYPKMWESLLSSAGVTQVFAPNDLVTAEYFSKRSGVRDEWQESYSESSSSGTNSSSSSESKNTHKVEKPVLSVHELMGMVDQAQALFLPNMKRCIIARRYPYFMPMKSGGTLYEGCYDPDPYHMTTEERAEFERFMEEEEW